MDPGRSFPLTMASALALLFTGGAFAQTEIRPEGGLAVDTGVSNRNNPYSDWALINGRVYTMNPDQPWATSIVVEDTEITYVGDADGLRDQIGIATEVVDLQTDDRDELFETLRQFVADNPDRELIEGYGVRLNTFDDGLPTAAMLDEIESERPIYLWAIDGHNAWVNSRALELAGVDRDTPDTVPGYSFFVRDEQNNPTGWIIEVPAQMQVLSRLREFGPDTILRGVEDWLPRFPAAGITTVFDYGVQGISNEEAFDWLTEREAERELPVRLQGSLYWNDPELDPIPPLLALREQYDSELVSVKYLKINLDGGDDKRNALFTEPCTDRPASGYPSEYRPLLSIRTAVTRQLPG